MTRKELDLQEGVLKSGFGIDTKFPSGITYKQYREMREAVVKQKIAADEKRKEQQRKKKNLAAKKKRAELKAAGKKVSRTADQKLEDNIVRMLTNDGFVWHIRSIVRRIMRAYKLTKK